MKLHIVSDLHLEFGRLVLPEVEAQVLVLAGDIGLGTQGVEWAKQYSDKYEKIIYVAGNHEYYGYHMESVQEAIAKSVANTNIVFLDNSVLSYQGIDFIGSTLWIDFCLYGKEPVFVEKAKELVSMSLNDFRQIGYQQKYFSVDDAQQLCVDNQVFLKNALLAANTRNAKKVVITHHAPSRQSIAKRYEGDIINCGFINDFDSLVAQSNLWIHGHTHSSFDYGLHDSRVVCNPRGYSKHQDRQENVEFKLDLVVEV